MNFPSFVISVLLGFGLAFSPGCANPQPQNSAAAPAPSAHSKARRASPPPADSIPGIAQREVIRRLERLRRADDAALRAHQAIADGNLEQAVSGYRTAIDTLPASP